MADNTPYDLVVIGGGPAGYAGALRAGMLGLKVACVEFERAGGTCLNWGCIPSKSLLKAAEMYNLIQHANVFGLTVKDVTYDFASVMGRSRNVADQMARGIEFLFKKRKVDYFTGRARIAVPGMVEITEGKDAGKVLSTKNILIATGCRPRRLANVPVDGEKIMTSREALAMKKQPKSITIIGAGAIGVEFAYFLHTFGTEVHLVEMMPQILPVEDAEIAESLHRAFKKQGMKVYTSTKVENVQTTETGVTLELVDEKGGRTPLATESLLLAIGVESNTTGLLSPKVQLLMERGYIKVNDNYETTVPGIFAAGDVIGPPWLAHVATFRAVQAVNGIAGHEKPRMVRNFPGCTYCQPQVASIGLTEKAARERGLKYKVGKFPFTASGKAVAINHAEGFVKLIISEEHGEILGAHIIGSDATELISEYVLALEHEITADAIHGTIHAHPTMSEALAEAAAAAYNEAIHI